MKQSSVRKPLKDRSGKLESGAHTCWEPPEQLEVPGKLHSGVEIQQTTEQAPASKPKK